MLPSIIRFELSVGIWFPFAQVYIHISTQTTLSDTFLPSLHVYPSSHASRVQIGDSASHKR